MTTHAEDLTTRFENVSGAFVATIERLDEAGLTRWCDAENCTVAALAAHIATVYRVHVDWVGKMVAGRPLPDITMEDINRSNAENAALNANLGKDEVLARVKSSREQLLAVLRGLSEGDSDRVVAFSLFPDGQASVSMAVELGVIAHTEEHLASVQATIDKPTTNPSES